jgi:VanZ family protein
MAAIFLASAQSDVPDLPGGLSNYTGHVLAYAALAAAATRAFARATWAGVTRVAATRAVVLSAAYGLTDELHQRLVPNRVPAMDDWAVDVIGAVAGAAGVMVLAAVVRARGRGTRSV